MLRTKLTTGEVEGRLFHAVGQRLRNGRAKLVSVANVAASHDWFQATLLGLPTEAFTLMDVSLDFVVE